MAHKVRQWQENYFYHITSRSNRKEPLFRSEEDFLFFLHLLEEINKKYPFEIAAYVLMKTHFHLLMRSNSLEYSKIMFLIKKKYATYFNRKYQTRGHLYDRRFFAKPANSQRTLLHMSRYIHFNPIAAHLVNIPEDYKWSSYQLFTQSTEDSSTPPYINFNHLLISFSGSYQSRKMQYINWCNAN